MDKKDTLVEQSAFVGFHRCAANIRRWPLMHQVKDEMLSTHLYECTMIGHLLGAIAADVFNEDIQPARVAEMCLWHEGAEVAGIGDIPSPIKNIDSETRKMVKALELRFEKRILKTLPEKLRARFEPLIIQDKSDPHAALAKSADILCAYIKTMFEISQHNAEFKDAEIEQKALVDAERKKYKCVDYFCEHFLTRSVGSLDSLAKSV